MSRSIYNLIIVLLVGRRFVLKAELNEKKTMTSDLRWFSQPMRIFIQWRPIKFNGSHFSSFLIQLNFNILSLILKLIHNHMFKTYHEYLPQCWNHNMKDEEAELILEQVDAVIEREPSEDSLFDPLRI